MLLLTIKHLECLEGRHAVLSELLCLQLEQLGGGGVHGFEAGERLLVVLEAQIFFVNPPHDVLLVLDFVEV